ncbi:MAG TPA: hypothetical protein VEL76_37390 [Gemmataceae bacterium]|nr:hypothetical protein [Gemmataceae bacterium]
MNSPPSPFSDPNGSSDSRDVITLYIDGPSDLPLGPVHPAVRKLLDADRDKIRQWQALSEQQAKKPPKDANS